ncbi:hypothetical protein BG023_11699 [Porphyrobacter sp. LM 6]|nr:hypothetical protein BG023_11699 [Porphyrobacter sp. LM 6]
MFFDRDEQINFNEFVDIFMFFLRSEGLVVPHGAQWVAFYKKIATSVADWQLPPAPPMPSIANGQQDEIVGILALQLHWAAENGRLFEAIKFLGALDVTDWVVRR